MDLSRAVNGTYTSSSPYTLLTVFVCLPETTLHKIQLLITAFSKVIAILG